MPESEYMKILEQLIRGNSLKKSDKSTRMFAKMFQKMMIINGCLGENKEIINERLRDALMEEKIDIQILCSALGRQKMDDNLFSQLYN